MRSLLIALLLSAACVSAAFGAANGIYTRSFSNMNALRAAAPTAEGEVVYLSSYLAAYFKGGGLFLGSLTAATDDGGMIIAPNGTTSTYHWRRSIDDFETLNVLHFGAYHDGSHDDHDAVLNMWKWSQRQTDNTGYNGIRFAEGSIYFSNIDISSSNVTDFALYGPTTPYGVRAITSITSDKTTAPAFKVCAQRVNIRGVAWVGQASATLDDNRVPSAITNTQTFFKNIYVGMAGQSIQVFGFQSANAGGHVFDVMNLYQSKFEQIYNQVCYGNVWNIGWSGADGTYWDHPRHVEISNVNIQQSYGWPGAINAPRMEQGKLHNIWIEKSRAPGDISGGNWVIDALNIEATLLPLVMNGTEYIGRQISLQSGATILPGTDLDEWLPASHGGYVRQDAMGILAMGPVASAWEAPQIRGSNTGNTSVWLNFGTFQTQSVGGVWEFEIISKIGAGVASSGDRPTNNGAPGITRITFQRTNSTTPVVSFTSEGSTGVTAVRYAANYGVYNGLFAQIAANVYEYGVFIRGTGITRYDAGVWNMFTISGETTADPPQYSVVVPGKPSLHNGVAGIGAEGNVVTMDTLTVAANAVNISKIAGYMIQKVNGKNVALPYYAAPASVAQDPPTGVVGIAAGVPTPSDSAALLPAAALICTLLVSTMALLT